MRQINERGIALIKRWEGIMDGDPTTVNLDPYLDPVGIWTIGWGHAITDPVTGKFLKGPGARTRAFACYPQGITRFQAEDLLRADLLDAAKDVGALIKVNLTDDQFAALVSFHFNTGSLGTSTLRKLLNKGNYTGAAMQFGKWIKGTVNGKKITLPGLISRRADERRLFLE